jgi:hypothetical protein
MVDDVLVVTSEDENVSVEVMDVTGRPFVKSQVKETNLSGLASGFYIIKAETATSTLTQKVYVK